MISLKVMLKCIHFSKNKGEREAFQFLKGVLYSHIMCPDGVAFLTFAIWMQDDSLDVYVYFVWIFVKHLVLSETNSPGSWVVGQIFNP